VFPPTSLNQAVNGGGGNRTRERSPDEPRQKAKWLYFVQAGGKRGPIKIGIARDLKERLRMLQVGNHLPLRVLEAYTFDGADVADIEQVLHSRLVDHLIVREWFKPHADVLAASLAPLLFVGDALDARERNRALLESA
jgi:hypothetical protein